VGDSGEEYDTQLSETTVFELIGEDNCGLLADVTQLLTHNGCDVQSAAVRPFVFTTAALQWGVLGTAGCPLTSTDFR
jgi:hypothetical protein